MVLPFDNQALVELGLKLLSPLDQTNEGLALRGEQESVSSSTRERSGYESSVY